MKNIKPKSITTLNKKIIINLKLKHTSHNKKPLLIGNDNTP